MNYGIIGTPVEGRILPRVFLLSLQTGNARHFVCLAVQQMIGLLPNNKQNCYNRGRERIISGGRLDEQSPRLFNP